MFYLYGTKRAAPRRLIATFDTEEQMLAYIRWATLNENSDGTRRFEQGTPLTGFLNCEGSDEALNGDPVDLVPLNPTPSML